MTLFKKSKINEVRKDLKNNIKIIIPADTFLECYRTNINKYSAKLDSDDVLQVEEGRRFKYLIDNINEIAVEALIDTLIEIGYKREGKKKWMNWF